MIGSPTIDTSTTKANGTALEPTMRQLVLIDQRVEDWRTLAADLAVDAKLVVLDPARDGVQAIADAAQGLRDLSAIHIVAHGRPGEVHLGGAILSSASLDRHADALARIGGVLKAGGDILLYGCDVARGAAGRSFIEQLAQITGADVAAAAHPVGASARGGSFDLDLRIGAIAAATPFAARSLMAFSGLLAGGKGGDASSPGSAGGVGPNGGAGSDGSTGLAGSGGGGGGAQEVAAAAPAGTAHSGSSAPEAPAATRPAQTGQTQAATGTAVAAVEPGALTEPW
jgi:fibronectin-binding autotransporter adhesin